MTIMILKTVTETTEVVTNVRGPQTITIPSNDTRSYPIDLNILTISKNLVIYHDWVATDENDIEADCTHVGVIKENNITLSESASKLDTLIKVSSDELPSPFAFRDSRLVKVKSFEKEVIKSVPVKNGDLIHADGDEDLLMLLDLNYNKNHYSGLGTSMFFIVVAVSDSETVIQDCNDHGFYIIDNNDKLLNEIDFTVWEE